MVAGRFQLTPRRVGPGSLVRLAWSLPWQRSRAEVDLYDLSGARIGPALPEAPVPPRGERGWRPEGLTPGLYLLVLRARSESGDESLSVTQLLRIEGGGP